MNRILSLIVLSLTLTGCALFQPNSLLNQEVQFPQPLQNVNQSAAIAVFIDGIQLDLAKTKYSQPNQTIYLDSKYPGIIRVKKAPLLWKDFFDQSLLGIKNNCLIIDDRSTYCSTTTTTLKIMLNGDIITDLYSKPIKQNDRLLISYGDETGVRLQRQENNIPHIQ